MTDLIAYLSRDSLEHNSVIEVVTQLKVKSEVFGQASPVQTPPSHPPPA
jgi:hypothetical protein